MLVGGFHLILDLEGCTPRLLDSKRAMQRLCRQVARLMGARILRCGGHRFSPKGVTAFCIIEESHISIHTWPESGRAFVDVFTCQAHFNNRRTADFIIDFTEARGGTLTLLMRKGVRTHRILEGRIVPQADFDFGRTIFSYRSRYQHIELTKGSLGVSLFLDHYWQFVERYEHIYHEMLVQPALAFAPGLRKVGIAGGGDGLALREVLKYPQLGRAYLYEIDPVVLSLAEFHPEMQRLNQRSLRHPKARVAADDARRMLRPGAGFDVLILDFPSMTDGHRFDRLYSAGFYRRARRALRPGGVLVTQVTDYPEVLWWTSRNLKQVFAHVLPIDIGVDFSMFNFVMASESPFRQRRPLPHPLRFVNQGVIGKLLKVASGSAAGPKNKRQATSAGRRPSVYEQFQAGNEPSRNRPSV